MAAACIARVPEVGTRVGGLDVGQLYNVRAIPSPAIFSSWQRVASGY